MATYDKEIILLYVENELSPEDRRQFEADLQSDPSLAAETALYKELRDTLQQRLPPDEQGDALRNTLGRMSKEYFAPVSAAGGAKIRPFRKYIAGIAAAAAVLAAVLVLTLSHGEDDLDRLGRTEMIGTMERGDHADSVLQKAAEYFNSGQFDKALLLLDEAVKADSSSQLALFYRGVARWHTGAAAGARTDLEKVYSGGSALQYEAALYMALSYAREKDKTAALEWLQKIPAGTPVSAKAQELTRKLE
jgi:tetratricopeptide (TPR) repeat protein